MLFNGTKMLFLCVGIYKTIQPFGKIARKMVYGKMIWDLSVFSLDFGMVITNFPNRKKRKKGRSGNKTLDTREVTSFEAIARETFMSYFK